MPPSLGVLSYLTNFFKTLKHFKTYIYLLMNYEAFLMNYEAYALYGLLIYCNNNKY